MKLYSNWKSLHYLSRGWGVPGVSNEWWMIPKTLKMCPYTRSRLLPIPNGHQSFKARPASADTRRGLFKLFCIKHLNTWIFQKSSIKWETAIMHFSHLPIGKMASVTAPNMKGIYFDWCSEAINALQLSYWPPKQTFLGFVTRSWPTTVCWIER